MSKYLGWAVPALALVACAPNTNIANNISAYINPKGAAANTTSDQSLRSRNRLASSAVPNTNNKGVGSPNIAQAKAGKPPQITTGAPSDRPRRRMTSASTTAPNQNNRGIATDRPTTRVACRRPRIMYSAKPCIWIALPDYLLLTTNQRPWPSV